MLCKMLWVCNMMLHLGGDVCRPPLIVLPQCDHTRLRYLGCFSNWHLCCGTRRGHFHYDGNAWTEMDSGTEVVLQNVRGSSATDVFALGSSGTILHYGGGQRKYPE